VHETASLKKGAGHPRTMVKVIGVGVACVGIFGYVIYRNQSTYAYVDPESTDIVQRLHHVCFTPESRHS
jgi:hypothetical protein